MRKKIFLICCLFCSLSTFGQNFDIQTLKRVNLERNTHLDGSMKWISNSEYVLGIAAPASVLAVGLIGKKKEVFRAGLQMTGGVVINTCATWLLKRGVNRPRPSVTYPFLQPLESEKQFSFPSGHTSNAFCNATNLALNYRKWYVVVPAYTWACTVAYSRMHLGMHYPSDVLAGAILGAGSAWFSYQANKWVMKKRKK